LRTAYIQYNLTHYSVKLVALAGVAEDHTVHIGAKQINVCSRNYMHAMARAVCMVVLVMFTIKRPKSSGPISRSVRVCRSHPSPQTVSLETTLRGRVMVSQSQSASPACSKFRSKSARPEPVTNRPRSYRTCLNCCVMTAERQSDYFEALEARKGLQLALYHVRHPGRSKL
jgi:hypothetical protein